MPTVYVLECKSGYFYVGKTSRTVEERFMEHISGKGSEFTKRFGVVGLVEVEKNCDEFTEDLVVKRYMKKHGICKVRGGSYSEMVLPEYQIKALEKELCTITDKCFKCGEAGHFANNCSRKKTFWEKALVVTLKVLDAISSDDERCYSCGREGHFAKDCYAKFHVSGRKL